MKSFMLCTIVGLFIGLIFTSRDKRESCNYILNAILGTVVGGCVSILVGITVICHMVPMKEVVYGPGKLVAMRSSDVFSGTFVWGSGSISNRTTYNFLQRMADNSMVPGAVPAWHKKSSLKFVLVCFSVS